MKPTSNDKSLAQRVKKQRRSGTVGALLFFSVFFLIGAAGTWFLLVNPWIKSGKARQWHEVECEIVSSQLKRHTGKSSTYKIDIHFRYDYEGRSYRSESYNFTRFASSSYEWKREIVDTHPAGRWTTALVNPSNPAEAVIDPSLTPDAWFGLIPLTFSIVGLAGIIWSLAKRRALRRRGDSIAANLELHGKHRESVSDVLPDYRRSEEPIELKTESSRRANFIGCLVGTVLWNGIVVAVMVARGGMPTFMFVLFGLVGAVLIVCCVYFFLALFNPQPIVIVSSEAIQPGLPLGVGWQLDGRVESITHLRIDLEGREQATYRRGTKTRTESEVFAKVPVLDTTDHQAMRSGREKLTIPRGTMHSFEAENNKIIWTLRVHGDVRFWPDIKDAFRLVVIPFALSEESVT